MNNHIIKRNTYILLFHVLIWSILILLPYAVSNAANQYRIGSIPGVFFSIAGFVHMVIFYVNACYLYPTLLNRRFWWLYIVASILLIAGSFQLKFIILENWFPATLKDAESLKFVFGPSVAVYVISIVYRRVLDQVHFERAQKEKQATYLTTQLKFLRSQVNPHFLFNVLTNMVALARKKSDLLEPSLIVLADLVRYMLYDTQEQKIELCKEITYLHSYIQLQQLRFGNDITINYTTDVAKEDERQTIEPMLLIPFVENAFKHGTGDCTNPWVNISLSLKLNVLHFEVSNSYHKMPGSSAEDHAGIGLNNVKERLDLLYKNNYTLTINDDGNTFQTTLILNLV